MKRAITCKNNLGYTSELNWTRNDCPLTLVGTQGKWHTQPNLGFVINIITGAPPKGDDDVAGLNQLELGIEQVAKCLVRISETAIAAAVVAGWG